MWTLTRSTGEVGRSRRSPVISVMTARRSDRLPERRTLRRCPRAGRRGTVRLFVDYCQARLVEDPHLWAETLLRRGRRLGFDQSYPTLTRQLRQPAAPPVLRGVLGGEGAAGGDHRAPAG